MAEFTNRLNLQKPAGGSSGTIPGDDPSDIDVINANMDKIDKAIGLSFVTSTTRPSTPYDGQLIKETDTQRFLAYRQSASNWEPVETPTSGSTALRDLVFGVPAAGAGGMAARVALANRAARWFNTEKGYEEQYYALYSDTPTTIMSKETAGWKGLSGQLAHPTAVSGAGAGNSVTMRGNRVVFSNTTIVNVDGIFDQDFDMYEIRVRLTSMASSADLLGRHRNGGVMAGTGQYKRSRNFIGVPASGNAMITDSATANVDDVIYGSASTAHSWHRMWVDGPAIARPTMWQSRSNDDRPLVQWASSTGPATAHDGFAIYGSGSPVIAGELVVIGYQSR